MNTNHTPTPWMIEPQAEVSAHRITDIDCIPIAEVRIVGRSEKGRGVRDDAAFIVRACNAHDELVAALQALTDAVVSHVPEMAAEQGFALGASSRGNLLCHAKNARAALAKVQEVTA